MSFVKVKLPPPLPPAAEPFYCVVCGQMHLCCVERWTYAGEWRGWVQRKVACPNIERSGGLVSLSPIYECVSPT